MSSTVGAATVSVTQQAVFFWKHLCRWCVPDTARRRGFGRGSGVRRLSYGPIWPENHVFLAADGMPDVEKSLILKDLRETVREVCGVASKLLVLLTR